MDVYRDKPGPYALTFLFSREPRVQGKFMFQVYTTRSCIPWTTWWQKIERFLNANARCRHTFSRLEVSASMSSVNTCFACSISRFLFLACHKKRRFRNRKTIRGDKCITFTDLRLFKITKHLRKTFTKRTDIKYVIKISLWNINIDMNTPQNCYFLTHFWNDYNYSVLYKRQKTHQM